MANPDDPIKLMYIDVYPPTERTIHVSSDSKEVLLNLRNLRGMGNNYTLSFEETERLMNQLMNIVESRNATT
jgi:hypothetical protein